MTVPTETGPAVNLLDLMADEFARIKILVANGGGYGAFGKEIEGICDRAVQKIRQKVPVITQRDEAENLVKQARLILAEIAFKDQDRDCDGCCFLERHARCSDRFWCRFGRKTVFDYNLDAAPGWCPRHKARKVLEGMPK